MPLFPNITRSDPGVMRHAEEMYAFLSRVDDPVFERIRQLLNDWFARYEALQPAKAGNDLAARVRAKQALQFEGAFWELYLHEAHVRLGFETTTCPDDVRHPDFVLTKGGLQLYLEATVTGKSPADVPAFPGAARIYDWINSASDPNFFVAVEILEGGATTPKRREVTAPLEEWLAGLAQHWRQLRDVVERGERFEAPRHRIPVRGWLLEFEARPKSEKARSESSFPMIGVYPGQAAWAADSASIVRAKVQAKSAHYGELDAPLVLALHDVTPFASRSVVREALFGSGRPLWSIDAGSANRVSALLAVSDFGMSSPARKTPELWLNPFADQPLPPNVLPWTTVSEPGEPDAAGVDPAALFGLARDWPGRPFQGPNPP